MRLLGKELVGEEGEESVELSDYLNQTADGQETIITGSGER